MFSTSKVRGGYQSASQGVTFCKVLLVFTFKEDFNVFVHRQSMFCWVDRDNALKMRCVYYIVANVFTGM